MKWKKKHSINFFKKNNFCRQLLDDIFFKNKYWDTNILDDIFLKINIEKFI